MSFFLFEFKMRDYQCVCVCERERERERENKKGTAAYLLVFPSLLLWTLGVETKEIYFLGVL